MEHGLDTEALAVVAGCVVLWGLVSARLERLNITAPIAFVLLGLLVAHQPVSLLDVQLQSSSVRTVAEVTLALVLFADASRVNVGELRLDLDLPLRLLGIGLPLTMAAGAAVAAALFGGVDISVALLIGAIVAPTDAALGASIMADPRVPVRVRRVLNVESGLNDGIAPPFVTAFLAAAVAHEAGHAEGVGSAIVDLLIGAGVGIGVGFLGAVLLRYGQKHSWSDRAFVSLVVLGLAVGAYAAGIEAGGNGFVAAFVGGMAFGTVMPGDDELTLGFTDDAGELLSMIVWLLFGTSMVVPAFEHLIWQDVVFAVLALTLVRMIPVALALIGTGLDRTTVAFVGWFGPRGLASVVFVLIAFDSLDAADGDRVLSTVTFTVLLSVLAHGITSSPFAARYGQHANGLHAHKPEHRHTPHLRPRPMRQRRT